MREPSTADLRRLFDLSVDMMCVVDDSTIQLANSAASAVWGHTVAELNGKPFLDLVHPDDRQTATQEVAKLFEGETTVSVNVRTRTADGEIRWIQWSARADPATRLIYAVGRDITNQRELHRVANTDQLTGLLNRRGFEARVAKELSRTEHYGKPMGLAMFDVDYFKRINDEHGHPMGDVALREVARRMEAGCRLHDVVSRWGGEEFAVLFPETTLEDARLAAERIALSVSAQPLVLGSAAISVRVSGGVTASTGSEADGLFRLVNQADASLLKAKLNGRDRIEVEELHDLKHDS